MTDQPDWTWRTPNVPGIHTRQNRGVAGPSQEELLAARQKFFDTLWREFLTIVGWYTPQGQAVADQLVAWANALLPPSVFQSFIDAIANALGHSGTGHNWSDIGVYLGLIPGGNIATPILASIVPGLDASKIISGQFAQTMISGLVTTLNTLLPTSTYQSLVDAIANALGHSGTGHTWTDIGTYLGLIPGGNISSPVLPAVIPGLDASKIITGTFAQTMITGLVSALNALLPTSTYQSLVDAIANALGHAGTGHTWTDIGTYIGLIPGGNIATAVSPSVIPGLDASKITTGTFAQTMITGLGAALAALLPTTTYQNLVDAIANALGHSGTGHTWSDIQTYLGVIPGPNIGTPITAAIVPAIDASKVTTGVFGTPLIPNITQAMSTDLGSVVTTLFGGATILPQVQSSALTGVFGQPNLGDSATSLLDQLVKAFGGKTGSDYSLGDVGNAAQQTATVAANANTVAQTATALQAAQAISKSGWLAVDKTMDATFPIGTITGSSVPSANLLNVTSSSAVSGYISTPDNTPKLAIAFWGQQSVTGITGIYINVFKVNTSTGVETIVHQSANLWTTLVGTGFAQSVYNLPSSLKVAVGDDYRVEMMLTGTGTYQLVFSDNSWMTPITTAFPKLRGATRNTSAATVVGLDAVGAGYSHALSAAGTVFVATEVHNAVGNGVIAFVVYDSTTSAFNFTVTCSYGATAMTYKNVYIFGTLAIYLFELIGTVAAPVPSGAQTVTATVTAPSSTQVYLNVNTLSYANVASFGTPVNNGASSAALSSGAVTSAVGQRVAQVFAISNTQAITSYNQTSRWSVGGGTILGTVVGDAPGASSVSFTAAVSVSTSWESVAVPVLPTTVPTTILSPVYAGSVPWFGLGNTTGVSTPVFAPYTWDQGTPGTYSVPVPSWANTVQRIILGGGGGGGGGSGGAGSAGGASWATVSGFTLTGDGGFGGITGYTSVAANANANGPGDWQYGGIWYYGGHAVVTQQPGSAPGGGGGAGNFFGAYGYGGSPGHWAADTQSAVGVSTVSVTVGSGGAPNASWGANSGANGHVWLVFSQ